VPRRSRRGNRPPITPRAPLPTWGASHRASPPSSARSATRTAPGSTAPVGGCPVTPLVGLLGGGGGHLVGDLAGLVADLISAGIDVEDHIQHRAQHVLADVSVAAFERV
jgi:hypothetical protein